MSNYRTAVGRTVVLVGLVGLLTASVVQTAGAQDDKSQRRKEWQQRSEQRIKEALGGTDEDWQKLQPMIVEVQTLMRDALPGRMGGQRGGATPAEGQTESEVQKCVKELEAALKDTNATDSDIEKKVDALREARKKAQTALAEARAKLRKAVTDRQAAQLVLLGILD